MTMHPRFSPFARHPHTPRMLLALLMGCAEPERWWRPSFKPPPRRPMAASLRSCIENIHRQHECRHEWNEAGTACVRCDIDRREVEYCGRGELVR